MNDPALFGRDLFGSPITHLSKLRERFVAPPFSVLMAQSGEWQARKRAWIQLGIKSEEGRPEVQARMKALAKYVSNGKHKDGKPPSWVTTSIFDPVLCECCYRWWCPPDGQIVDPFAGGSVRGIVAGALGYKYWGCDLSEVQVEANRTQSGNIDTAIKPKWVCGDSREKIEDAPDADFLFSCPPYGDLEVYSDDPKDISTMSFPDFVEAYKEIIKKSCERLKDNRFACFVVGDFRNKDGILQNFPGLTNFAFKQAGLKLYNENILATVAGTAMVRASRQFLAGRKNVRTHQNVLVYVKGDWHEAAKAMNSGVEIQEEQPELESDDLETPF